MVFVVNKCEILHRNKTGVLCIFTSTLQVFAVKAKRQFAYNKVCMTQTRSKNIQGALFMKWNNLWKKLLWFVYFQITFLKDSRTEEFNPSFTNI